MQQKMLHMVEILIFGKYLKNASNILQKMLYFCNGVYTPGKGLVKTSIIRKILKIYFELSMF